MNALEIVVLVVAAIFVSSVIVMLVITVPIAKKQYEETFVRTSPEKWTRANSCPENAEHSVMYDIGIAWAAERQQYMKEVSVVSDGLKLVGEFYDFGYDKSAILLAGRAEALKYNYYYASPYEELGYNILVIDPRAHGESEGKYSCVGIKEVDDVQKWAELIHDEYHSSEIVVHGLCVGSAAAVYLAARNIPYIKMIAVEGLYISFYNVLKQRTKTSGHPTFPVVQELAFLIHHYAGVNIFAYRPVDFIKKVNIPVLFLCGKEDASSVPKYFNRLFDNCASQKKEIVWFDHGAHSHLRISNTLEYDRAIKDFIKNNCEEK